MASRNLTSYLEIHRVPFRCAAHRPAFTAHSLARRAHVSLRRLLKSVLVSVDGELIMVVLPAAERLNMELLRAELHARHVELAKESEFMDLFYDSDVGAMPPFGNLYGLKVYALGEFAESDEVTFNACSHRETITLLYGDFRRLVNPQPLCRAGE